MIDWSKHDSLLVSLIATHGQRWKLLAPVLRKHNISTHAARNRWQRICTPTKGKNKCKLCGNPKRGHTYLTCVKKPLNFQSEILDSITEASDNHSLCSDIHDEHSEYDVYEYSMSRFDYFMLQENFYMWPDLQASHTPDTQLNASIQQVVLSLDELNDGDLGVISGSEVESDSEVLLIEPVS